MYYEFFGLRENPFTISPNPDYLYLSERHKEALAHLQFGLSETGGFVMLTGEVGTGKTTVARNLVRQLDDRVDVAFLDIPNLDEAELPLAICQAFGIEHNEDDEKATLNRAIIAHLYANYEQGIITVLMIDEAQHLNMLVLEQLRLLTNVETDTQKLLRVVLIGQPELQHVLNQANLRQLAQRITARYHLLPLTAKDTADYIAYRLHVGSSQQRLSGSALSQYNFQLTGGVSRLFSPALTKYIFQLTGGVPRLINLLCDRTLLAAYSRSAPKLSRSIVKQAARDLGLLSAAKHSDYLWPSIALVSLLACTSLLYWQWSQSPALENQTSLAGAQSPEVQTPSAPSAALATASSENPSELASQARWQQVRLQNSDIAIARDNLFKIWGYRMPVGQANCSNSHLVGLYCRQEQGGLALLKQLNYPAVIELEEENQRFYAVVRHVDEDIELWLGEQRVAVTPLWLSSRWRGQFELLWPAPLGFDGVVKLGQRGPIVSWLKQHLGLVQGVRMNDDDRFDEQLKQQVLRFQQDNALAIDGLVGSHTLMRLAQQVFVEHPRLGKH